MVLVAPDPIRVRPTRGRPEGAEGPALLAQLRAGTGAPPRFEGLAGGLRAWLEDAAFAAVVARGDGAPPLSAGPRRLLGAAGAPGGDAPVEGRVLARLVRALFRQLVTVGVIGVPLRDALDAVRADGGAAELVRHVESMERGAREALARTVEVHAAHLGRVVPRFSPADMPRTDDRVAIPLAGGRVVLAGVFDLLLSSGARGSLCAIGVTVDGPRDRARWTLHYLALLELLRSGRPPFRVALVDSATGSFSVEDVREEHVLAIAAHVAEWLGGGDGAWAWDA
jgi:hypothetical protein